jgi:hypothetical protein
LAIKSWSRKKKLTAGLSALCILLVAGVAVALLVLRAPLQGGGTVVAAPNLRYVSATVIDTATQNAQCSASVLNGGSAATVNMGNVVTGTSGRCRIRFGVVKEGTTENMVLQSVRWSSLTSETPIGSCGAPIGETETSITVDFEVPASATPQSFTADEANAGLTAISQADYNPASLDISRGLGA